MKPVFVLALVLALFAGACSGGDGVSIDAAADAAGSADGDTGSDSGGFGGGDWCERARSVDETIDGIDISLDLDGFRAVVSELENIGDGAPAEIADDIDISLDGFRLLVDALEDADGDFFAIDESRFAEIDDPKYQQAADNIQTYLEDECGIVDDDDVFGDADDMPLDEEPAGDDAADSGDDFEMPEGGDMTGVIAQALVSAGFTEDEAACLAQEMDIEAMAELTDPTQGMEFFEACDIDMSRLAELGG